MTWNSLYSRGCLELLTFCWSCGMSLHLAFEIILLAPNTPTTFRILAFHPVLCTQQWWFCHRKPHYACSMFAVFCHVHGMTLASQERLWRRPKAQYFCLVWKSALANKNHVRLSAHIRKDCCVGEAGNTRWVSIVSSREDCRRSFLMKALEYTAFDVSRLLF